MRTLKAFFLRAFIWTYDSGERIAAWWQTLDEPHVSMPRPLFWGWCLDCRPETVGMPGFVTAKWKCERCGSGSVINVRAGGVETVRA